MSGDNPDLDALREQTDTGSRLSQDANNQSSESEVDPFEKSLRTALSERQKTGAQRTVSVWDGELAALLDALEENPDRMESIGTALQDALDRDPNPEDIDRTGIMQLAIRSGLQDADPELVEAWREAVADAAKRL
ncbi:hypothetical protein [Halococcus sp. IIIV-5B]|uniref:hypothetical protein n=1 Tax=Halococcus sp. IIIV-5B TaxID=2321230 RepID=UPI000E76D2C7|nr:hypothetical protein [Halococcus sp. IIIV-5B]RJT07504.1 hypothetical protein D3261_02580 [Halococcus sp. IIIV-5B]